MTSIIEGRIMRMMEIIRFVLSDIFFCF